MQGEKCLFSLSTIYRGLLWHSNLKCCKFVRMMAFWEGIELIQSARIALVFLRFIARGAALRDQPVSRHLWRGAVYFSETDVT